MNCAPPPVASAWSRLREAGLDAVFEGTTTAEEIVRETIVEA